MALTWRGAFNLILPDLPKEQLHQCVLDCEDAIFVRFQELRHEEPNGEHSEIAEALHTIRRVQVEKLGYPDFNPENVA